MVREGLRCALHVTLRGYFDQPDQLPMNQGVTPHGCYQAATCFGYNDHTARAQARQSGLDVADLIRTDDIYIYTIGLGNPTAGNPLLVPDTTYLQQLANMNGVASASQAQGRSYFAPSAADLHAVFQAVAQDLLVRLSR